MLRAPLSCVVVLFEEVYTYISPRGKTGPTLTLYVTPRVAGLQTTHNTLNTTPSDPTTHNSAPRHTGTSATHARADKRVPRVLRVRRPTPASASEVPNSPHVCPATSPCNQPCFSPLRTFVHVRARQGLGLGLGLGLGSGSATRAPRAPRITPPPVSRVGPSPRISLLVGCPYVIRSAPAYNVQPYLLTRRVRAAPLRRQPLAWRVQVC